ncbi:MAG: glycosyltransferase family 2 protein [Acidobacteriota bacterium]
MTAVLCTLNEEENIQGVIESVFQNGVTRVILVDAGSADATVARAKELGVECHVVPRNGLAYQRQFGVDLVSTDCVCLVDADNRLERDCLQKLMRYLRDSEFVGVAAQKISAGGEDYWSRALTWNNQQALYTLGEKLVVGTPAIYYTDVLRTVRYDTAITGSSDDTDLCYRLSKLGKKVGVGPGVCRELMRNTFAGFAKKLLWYGRGDAEFFLRHPEKRWTIAVHPLKNYVIKGQFRALMRGRPDMMPYFAISGFIRTFGFWRGLLEIGLFQRARIYKT